MARQADDKVKSRQKSEMEKTVEVRYGTHTYKWFPSSPHSELAGNHKTSIFSVPIMIHASQPSSTSTRHDTNSKTNASQDYTKRKDISRRCFISFTLLGYLNQKSKCW